MHWTLLHPGIMCELGKATAAGVNDPGRNFHNQTSSTTWSSVKTLRTDGNRGGFTLFSMISLAHSGDDMPATAGAQQWLVV